MNGVSSTQNAIRVSERILAHLEKMAIINGRLTEEPWLKEHASKMDVHSAGLATEAVKLWRKEGRQALAIHPGIVAETRMATSDKVPPQVFRAIPYLNPLVVYPDPPVIDGHRPGETLRLLGFLTYAHGISATRLPEDVRSKAEIEFGKDGRARSILRAGTGLALTDDPDATMLGMFAVLEVLDEYGRVIAVEENMISTPLVGPSRTIKELGQEVENRYQWQTNTTDQRRQIKFLQDVQAVMIGSLLYLCSTTLEAQEVPRKFVAKMRPGVARKPISLYKVGWETGTAISHYRRMVVTGQTPNMNRAGREQDPQQRRAHTKIVWTGPGRTIPKTALVLPYWTHREKLGAFGTNTVRAVK